MWELIVPGVRGIQAAPRAADATLAAAILLLQVVFYLTIWWNFVRKAGYSRWHMFWAVIPFGWIIAALVLVLRRWPAQWELIRYRIRAGAATVGDARAILGLPRRKTVIRAPEMLPLYDAIAKQFAGTEVAHEALAERQNLTAAVADLGSHATTAEA
ncbi:MAG: hypothetical protein ABFD92_06805 [Planctomycetaceae bacterium]|nr:hypothetical protein [Planctomycetaceae bacterium]